MPETNTRSRTATGAAEPLAPVRENRIDPPHPMANGREVAPSDTEARDVAAADDPAEVEVASLAMVQQLRLQAQQLSQHLSQQQQDLDRREAELQARSAQLEQQERNNRLWLKERHEELSEREAALVGREQALADRANELVQLEQNIAQRRRDGDEELQARREAIERRTAAVQEAEEQAAVRANEIETAAAALKDAGQVHEELVADLERRTNEFDSRRGVVLDMISRFLAGQPVLPGRPKQTSPAAATTFAGPRATSRFGDRKQNHQPMRDEFDELVELLDQLQSRREHIGEVEALLQRAESEVAELRQTLLADRNQFDGERQEERRRHEELRRRAAADLAQRQEALEAASQQLELRRAAVEQMRAELTVAQREALENRLAAEELTAQLAGAIPPAQLSHQIARSRARLAECYRLQQEGILDERRRLEALAVQITEQHGRLAAQKRDLEHWLRERTAEAEAETARLAQRERQLDRQRDLVEKQRFDWEHERQEYQHHIRRLLAELGQ